MRTAPYNLIAWTNPTPLTTNFREFNVYARAAVLPAGPFVKIATYSGTGYPGLTPTQVEANLTKFRDYMAGWGGIGSPWARGWEYVVTVVNKATRLESRIFQSTVNRSVNPADEAHWFVSNSAPFLNFPARVIDIEAAPSADHDVLEDGLAGRAYSFTRTNMERAGRTQALDWYYHSVESLPEELARWPYALAESGRTSALLVPFGDRYVGTLRNVKVSRSGGDGTKLGIDAELVETDDWQLADYNLPPGFALNGSSQYVSVASTAALNPGTAAFSFVWSGTLTDTSGTFAAKWNGTSGQGYYLQRPSANTVRWGVLGATTGASVDYTNAALFANGKEHALVGTYDGAELRLYVDGVLVKAAKVTAGAISNSIALTAGAVNGGASGFKAGTWYAVAQYGYKLTDDEALAASGWLLGWSGYKMPGGGNVFLDSRDDRSYTGQGTNLEDLSGNLRRGALVGAPLLIGRPWRLRELDILVPVA